MHANTVKTATNKLTDTLEKHMHHFQCQQSELKCKKVPNISDQIRISNIIIGISYQHSHTLSTHLSSQASSPLHSSRLGLPHCSKKPTLNTYLIENYRPVSLLPFIAKTLEWVQVSLFLSQNNKLDAKQSGFRSGHSTETLLTLSIIRSSCPPSHHWTSLGFHFTVLNHISLVGLSGEGRYPKHINWSLGFPRDRFLDHSSFPHTLHHWLPSYRCMGSHTIAMLMTHSSISHFDQMIQR